MIYGIVYGVRCMINDKWYVGQTVRTLSERKREHLRDAKWREQGMLLHKAIKRYGEDSFEWAVIQEYQSKGDLEAGERYWANRKNSFTPNGYNIHAGEVRATPKPHDKTHREKISDAIRRVWADPLRREKQVSSMSGRKRPVSSRKWTDEQKKQASLAAKQRLKEHPQSEDVKRIMRESHASKLTDIQVLEIRRLLKEGGLQKEICRQFGVTPSCISGIATGRTWRTRKSQA